MDRFDAATLTGIASAWGLPGTVVGTLGRDNAWQQRARLLQTWHVAASGTAPDRRWPWQVAPGAPIDPDWVGPPPPPGVNFISAAAAAEADRALSAAAAEGAMMKPDRLRRDFLSSQPLCFNTFGHLSAPEHADQASAVCAALWPDLVERVHRIRYEYNPRRGPYGPTGTRSAFDVFIDASGPTGRTFVAVEIKYHEDMSGPVPPRHMTDPVKSTARLHALEAAAARVGVDLDHVLVPRLHQPWLDHALALALLDPSVQTDLDDPRTGQQFPRYTAGAFVMLAPAANTPVWDTMNAYRAAITAGHGTVADLTLDRFLHVAERVTGEGWPATVRTRYLDTGPVVAALASATCG